MSKTHGATRDLAKWVVNRDRRGAASDRALDLAELSIVDTIACALAGTCEPGPWALKRTRNTGDGMPSSIWGMGGAAEPRDAALLNGMLAHMLDFDDGDMVSRGHPSCILVPAVLALAEARRLSGAAVLDAFLTGYYVIQLIGRISGKSMAKRGFHVSGMTGVIGAAAALCQLLDLTADQTATALGIAATTAAGLRANFGTDMKPYHAGRAAACAVEAVEMVIAGITASPDILESKDGFLWVNAEPDLAKRVEGEVERLVAGQYSIVAEPPNLKLYACCHSTHACIAALLRLRPQLIDRLDSIREIVAETQHTAAIYLTHPRPRNGLEGKFSMEGSLAIALIDGRAGVAQFTDEAFHRADVQSLLRKVRFITSDRLEAIHAQEKMPGSVTVSTDKKSFHEEVEDPRGCRTDPLNFDDVAAKFRDCASGVLLPRDVDSGLETLSALRRISDIGSTIRQLRGSAKEPEKRATLVAAE